MWRLVAEILMPPLPLFLLPPLRAPYALARSAHTFRPHPPTCAMLIGCATGWCSVASVT